MRKYIISIFFYVLFFMTPAYALCSAQVKNNEYLVLANQSIKNDSDWNKVVQKLSTKHDNAPVIYYEQYPDELLSQVRKIKPKYVGIVDKPEYLNREFIIRLNRFSRTIDDDIYVDFLWGVITGYKAASAEKMVDNSTEPLIIKSCVSTIMETDEGKWFDSYAYMDDQNMGIYGYKMPGDKSVKRERLLKTIPATRGSQQVPDLLPIFYEMYEKVDPDLIITASHASEKALEMPFSAGFIKAKDGELYAELPEGNKKLVESGKRRVYLPIGNCLIGNIDNTKNSMALAWMNSANVTTFVGYVVSTWYGRSGWGGLKYFLTSPGRYTIAESFFLNQQDMLAQMNNMYPKILDEPYTYNESNIMSLAAERLEEVLDRKPTNDEVGFWYDLDILALYGDPKWDVRLIDKPEERDFTVTGEYRDKQYILTINTGINYSHRLVSGDHFKEVHVLDLPFSHIFPERLNNPRLADGQNWDIVLDENFILLYNNVFGPNNTYQIILNVD